MSTYIWYMKNQAENIGKNIRRLRLERGWTQQDLANKLGTTQKTVTAYECGTRYPTAEKIPVIANLFGVSINDLYGATVPPKRRKAKNPRLWKRFQQVEQLPETDKRSVFRTIEGLLSKKIPPRG